MVRAREPSRRRQRSLYVHLRITTITLPLTRLLHCLRVWQLEYYGAARACPVLRKVRPYCTPASCRRATCPGGGLTASSLVPVRCACFCDLCAGLTTIRSKDQT